MILGDVTLYENKTVATAGITQLFYFLKQAISRWSKLIMLMCRPPGTVSDQRLFEWFLVCSGEVLEESLHFRIDNLFICTLSVTTGETWSSSSFCTICNCFHRMGWMRMRSDSQSISWWVLWPCQSTHWPVHSAWRGNRRGDSIGYDPSLGALVQVEEFVCYPTM